MLNDAIPSASIEGLTSLGPQSQAILTRAGIKSVAQLRELGAAAAYARTKRCDRRANLNLLWALESVLTGEPWRQVAKRHRTSLLLAVDDLERSAG